MDNQRRNLIGRKVKCFEKSSRFANQVSQSRCLNSIHKELWT